VTDLELRRALPVDRVPVYRMLELYQHDLSDIWDQDLDDRGEYGYALDRYWERQDCHVFVARVAGRYAGFALVDGAVKVRSRGYWMDQFCILKKYRRGGVGAALATYVFNALPGAWEVGEMADNLAAQKFWHAVIAAYTQGQYTEHTLSSGWWQGVVQCFSAQPGA
jgi:predicted acetyltransferase